MMGCLLAFSQGWMRKKLRWLTHPAVFAALGLLTLFSQDLLPRIRQQIFFGGLVPLIIALLLYAAMERADWFLNNRLTSVLGPMTYSLYLWQQPFLNRQSAGWWAAFPVNLLLALACGVGSHYIVERPFLRMGRKATGHGEGDASAGVAALPQQESSQVVA